MGCFFLILILWIYGNVNLCDLGIMIVVLMIGLLVGGVVGGLSGMILDLIFGYVVYVFFFLIVYGLEGWVIGNFYQ